jgi:hypothetical protein
MWISTEAYEALRRMARRDGVTQRELIDRLLVKEQNRIMRRLSDEELSAYLSND